MQSEFYLLKEKIDKLTSEYSSENFSEAENYFDQEGIFDYFIKRISRLLNTDWLIPLKDNGFFDPSKNPPPQELPDKKGYLIPYWSVLRYLEIVARENSKNPQENITKALLEIVNKIIAERVDNYHTDWIMLFILSTLPTELISSDHIEFIRSSLHSKWNSSLIDSDLGKLLIPKLIKDKSVDLLLNLIDVILDYKKQDDQLGREYVSIMDQYWLAEALKKHKLDISKFCGIDAANIAIAKMKEILKEDDSHFNEIWVPTIEDHPQITFPERYESQIVQFVRDMYEFYPEPKAILKSVKSLLSEDHPIFKRIAFYLINKHYVTFKDLFWESRDNPLDVLATHEIYELLKNNCKKFIDTEIEKLITWIEKEEYPISDEIKNDKEQMNKFIARRKMEWLSALEEIKNDNKIIFDMIQFYNNIFPYKIDHPGFSSWSESGSGSYESPISTIELCSRTNQKIAEYLRTFEDEGKFVWDKLTEISMTETFKQCVVSDPAKFSNELEPFLEVQPIYVIRLLWGLTEAWRGKKDFEWKKILEFTWKLIEPDSFWKESLEKGKENYRNSTIRAIADLIGEGIKNDDHAFSPDILPLTEKILLYLLEKTESDIQPGMNYPTAVLNSTKGRIYSALVNYSLRYARLYKRKDIDRWKEEVKTEFTKRLDKNVESTPEFRVILGQYIANLYYLDKKWVEENIKKIFSKDDHLQWEIAMTGYLYFASKVYKEIYDLLNQSGQYKNAIHATFRDKFANERLIQHLCIAFIQEWESLEEDASLIKEVLVKSDPNQLRELTAFIWTLRGKLDANQKNKVKQLWGKIVTAVGDKLNQSEYRQLATNLTQWLALVDEIDNEIFEWMKQLVKFIDKDHFNHFIVKSLLKHVEKTPKQVGEIYIEMLSHDVYPTYKEEQIQELVRKLYVTHPELADGICNMYGSKGYVEILEDVYKEYHVQTG